MNPAEIKELITKSKRFNVLYVEDCEDVRNQTIGLLNIFFDNVDVAENGQEGLSKYKGFYFKNKSYYDIVISDLNMPHMDGTTMSKKILEINSDQPVLIVSAHDESEKLQELIDINITQYIHKPIKYDPFIDVVAKLIQRVLGSKEKEEHIENVKKLNFELKHNLEDLAINFSEAIPSPVFVLCGNNIVSINKAFENLLSQKELLTNELQPEEIGSLIFEQKDGYAQNLYDIEEGKNFEKKFFYKNDDEVKIFIPTKTKIKTPIYQEDTFLVLFDDVYPFLAKEAMVEYQKNKIETYNKLLEELLVKKSFKTSEPVVKKTNISEEKKNISQNSMQKDIETFNEEKYVSSKEFLTTLNPKIINEEIGELESIREDLEEAIDTYAETTSKEDMKKVAKLLFSYSNIIGFLVEFENLVHAINSLANFLLDLDEESLKIKKSDIVQNLDHFIDDLVIWRENVFFNEETVNIHYLDNSLFNLSLQLQIMVASKEEDDHGHLELF